MKFGVLKKIIISALTTLKGLNFILQIEKQWSKTKGCQRYET